MGLSESGTPQIIQKGVFPVPYCTYMTAFDQSEYGDLLHIMAPVTSVTPENICIADFQKTDSLRTR